VSGLTTKTKAWSTPTLTAALGTQEKKKPWAAKYPRRLVSPKEGSPAPRRHASAIVPQGAAARPGYSFVAAFGTITFANAARVGVTTPTRLRLGPLPSPQPDGAPDWAASLGAFIYKRVFTCYCDFACQ